MRGEAKTIFFYVVALAGLIGASLLFANQGEPPVVKPLPTIIPPAHLSESTRPSTTADLNICANTAQGVITHYVPGASSTTVNLDSLSSVQ